MSAIIETPVDLVEAIADLRFPPKTDEFLQALMDRNNDGALTVAERDELEALVELSETMALVRARALKVLGRKPDHDPKGRRDRSSDSSHLGYLKRNDITSIAAPGTAATP